MTGRQQQVADKDELLAALAHPDTRNVLVTADLVEVPGFRLSPGQTLRGSGQSIRFAAGHDGVQLSADNEVASLALVTETTRCALLNDTSVAELGRISLHDLSAIGCIRLLARDNVRGGHVEVHGVHIIAADARGFHARPKGYGVEVIPGAFTLWNQQSDAAVSITADLTGLSAGRAGAPVRGSGVFVSGAGDTGGRLVARRLETGAVFSDGGIKPGTPDQIAGGVFVVHGAFVDCVRNHGPVTTYGANDMALDNWGTVDAWIAEDKIASHGPSGIGFVNFGTISRLESSLRDRDVRAGRARLQCLHRNGAPLRVRSHRHAWRWGSGHPNQPTGWRDHRAAWHRDLWRCWRFTREGCGDAAIGRCAQHQAWRLGETN
jgi:hypothetical protein